MCTQQEGNFLCSMNVALRSWGFKVNTLGTSAGEQCFPLYVGEKIYKFTCLYDSHLNAWCQVYLEWWNESISRPPLWFFYQRKVSSWHVRYKGLWAAINSVPSGPHRLCILGQEGSGHIFLPSACVCVCRCVCFSLSTCRLIARLILTSSWSFSLSVYFKKLNLLLPIKTSLRLSTSKSNNQEPLN